MVMLNENIVRAALYIRVSTEEQALHGISLQAQEDELVKVAKEKGWKIVKIYRDEGNSARKPALKRPVMLELLNDVKAGKLDLIAFVKLDRWFRNVREFHLVQEVLDKYRVEWTATREDYSTLTADARLKLNLMLSIAENESDRTSERIKFVFQAKRNRKEWCFTGGPGQWPYGYMPQVIDGVKRCVKDPEKEAIVQDFWDYVVKYNSVRKAGMYVCEKYGITRHYRTWTNTARNEIYTGTFRGVEDYCPAYISRADWERIILGHEIIKKTQKPERVYLFTGLIRCPECGNTMKGTFKTYPPDRMIEYNGYRCNNSQLRACPFRHQLSEKKIEKYLLQNIQNEMQKYIIDTEVERTKTRRVPKAYNLATLNEQLRRLNAVYIAGNMPDEEYTRETKQIKAQIEKAKQYEQAEAPVNVEKLKQFLKSDFLATYQQLSKEDKRRMWRTIIAEIYVKKTDVVGVKFRL